MAEAAGDHVRKDANLRDSSTRGASRGPAPGACDPRSVASLLGNRALSEALAGEGRPLDPATRLPMEARLGVPLDDVRVHRGPAVDRATDQAQARAIAVSTAILIGRGEPAPSSTDGRRLLAHELAHVAQSKRAGTPRRSWSEPGDSFEQHAEAVAGGSESAFPEGAPPVAARQERTSQPPGFPVQTQGGLAVRAVIQQARDSDLPAIIAELTRAVATARPVVTDPITVDVGGPQMIASYEAAVLLAEAKQRAALTHTATASPVVTPQQATKSVAGPAAPDVDRVARATSGAAPAQGDVGTVRARIAQARELADDPNSGLSDAQRGEIRAAADRAASALRAYEEKSGEGGARKSATATIGVISGGVVADDATGIGVADDPALILLGLAFLLTLALTRPGADPREVAEAWRRVGENLGQIGEAGAGIVLAVQGARAAGQLTNIAVHLARLLALGSVGGVPSGEPPKKDDRDDKHWWSEIKGSVRQFAQAVKGASRKQVIRELVKRGFTEAQIAEIEAALARAAEAMGEAIESLLPPP